MITQQIKEIQSCVGLISSKKWTEHCYKTVYLDNEHTLSILTQGKIVDTERLQVIQQDTERLRERSKDLDEKLNTKSKEYEDMQNKLRITNQAMQEANNQKILKEGNYNATKMSLEQDVSAYNGQIKLQEQRTSEISNNFRIDHCWRASPRAYDAACMGQVDINKARTLDQDATLLEIRTTVSAISLRKVSKEKEVAEKYDELKSVEEHLLKTEGDARLATQQINEMQTELQTIRSERSKIDIALYEQEQSEIRQELAIIDNLLISIPHIVIARRAEEEAIHREVEQDYLYEQKITEEGYQNNHEEL